MASRDEILAALKDGTSRASARWAYPHDLSEVHFEGRVIAYCDRPMVCIETDTGEHVWWRADMTVIDEAGQ